VKELIFKTISPFLALLVLLSTLSWTVDKHLCMGRVMDVAFFHHAEDCGMESAMKAFGESDNHCCDDESFTINGQDDLKLSWEEFDVECQELLVVFTASYSNLLSELSEQQVPHECHPPPLLVKDFNTLYEVYLI
jgi:hypothetical protein